MLSDRSEEHSHRWIKFEGVHAVRFRAVAFITVSCISIYEIHNEVLREVVPENNRCLERLVMVSLG